MSNEGRAVKGFNLLTALLIISVFGAQTLTYSIAKAGDGQRDLAGDVQDSNGGGATKPHEKAPQEYNEYFTLEEERRALRQGFSAALEMAEEMFNQTLAAKPVGGAVSLFVWVKHNETPETPSERYNRKTHFGTWVKDSKSCFNTRGVILSKTSRVPVELAESGCSVAKGEWEDPYVGKIVTVAKELDIDHFVPLKNAYVSGAYTWTREKRCRYGNFMANDFHLLAVDASENRSKGDHTPAEYIPPNQAYLCQYLSQWLKIKMIWNLIMTPPEAEAIKKGFQDNRCSINWSAIEERVLAQQRNASDSDPVCARGGN